MATWTTAGRATWPSCCRKHRIIACAKGYGFQGAGILDPDATIQKSPRGGSGSRAKESSQVGDNSGSQAYSLEEPFSYSNSADTQQGRGQRGQESALSTQSSSRQEMSGHQGGDREHDRDSMSDRRDRKPGRGRRGRQGRHHGSRGSRSSAVWDTPGVEAAAAAAELQRTHVRQGHSAAHARTDARAFHDRNSADSRSHGARQPRSVHHGHRGSSQKHMRNSWRERGDLRLKQGRTQSGNDKGGSRRESRDVWGHDGGRQGGRTDRRRVSRRGGDLRGSQHRGVQALSQAQEGWRLAMADYLVADRKKRQERVYHSLMNSIDADLPQAMPVFERGNASVASSRGRLSERQGEASWEGQAGENVGIQESGWFTDDDDSLQMYETEYARFLPAEDRTTQFLGPADVHDIVDPAGTEGSLGAEDGTWWLAEDPESSNALNTELDALLDMLEAGGDTSADAQLPIEHSNPWGKPDGSEALPDPFALPGDRVAALRDTSAPSKGLDDWAAGEHAAAADAMHGLVPEADFAFEGDLDIENSGFGRWKSAWSLVGVRMELQSPWQSAGPPKLPDPQGDASNHGTLHENLMALLTDTENKLADQTT